MQNSRESDGEQRAGEERPAAESPTAERTAAQAPSTGADGAPPLAGRDAGELVDELARMEDRYKRALADLDNYRKRSQREIERRVAEATGAVLRDWLEAVDSVERALRMAPEDPCNEGLRAVLEQMDGILARQGVRRIGAPGEAFDPERHEAVAVRTSTDAPDRTVLGVERSGFESGERVVRPAQVVVARTPERAA
jgi:molecular chaperone GrpE